MSQPRRDPGFLRIWWPLWLALVALTFAVPETVAIVHPGQGGTLSEMTREWLGTTDGQASGGWVALTAVLAGFVVWFSVHIRSGWPWERSQDDGPDQPGDG